MHTSSMNQTPKKVLFVATVVKTHIMEFHLPYLKMLQDMGPNTAVAAKNDYDDPADCVIPHCDTYYPVDFARNPLKRANLRAYRQLKQIIDAGDYAIIHCHTPVAAILTRLAARKARKKGTQILYTAHGFHFYRGAPLLNWLVYFPAEWICSFMTDTLITINQEDYAFASKHMHPGRVEYVPGVGVPMERFGIYGEQRQTMRQSLGLKDSDFVLLSVAELTPNKNHAMMLRALASLPEENIRLICAGRGQERQRLLELTRALKLEDRVQFLGYRSDVGKLYAAADAFLFPSFREGLSLSLMEAMASGLPSIVGAIRGNTDLISDGVEGILTELTPEAIAASIQRLRRDPAMGKAMGAAAREKVKQFSLENVEKDMDAIYRSCL